MAGIVRKVGPKDSRFLHFSFPRFRSVFNFPLSSDYDRQNERERERRDGILLRTASPAREMETGTEVLPRSSSSVARRAEVVISSTRRLSTFRALCRCRAFDGENGDSGAISGNGKLENLVRLALKRLNVSYLTISSRFGMVRARGVRVSRAWRREEGRFSIRSVARDRTVEILFARRPAGFLLVEHIGVISFTTRLRVRDI